MVPLIGPGYRPVDADEHGMWQQMERVEEEISGSNLLVRDPALASYLKGLIGKVGGPAARDMRIYLARIPDFNAVMFPTGMTVIFTGLLLRMRNEAQLAGVIAHESGAFPAQAPDPPVARHAHARPTSSRSWRWARASPAALRGSIPATSPSLAQLGTILSLLRYNRMLEAEADAMGVRLLAEQGYDPRAMAETWAAADRRGGTVSAKISAQAPPPRHWPVLHPPDARIAHGRSCASAPPR